jgi:hypothetical protein
MYAGTLRNLDQFSPARPCALLPACTPFEGWEKKHLHSNWTGESMLSLLVQQETDSEDERVLPAVPGRRTASVCQIALLIADENHRPGDHQQG